MSRLSLRQKLTVVLEDTEAKTFGFTDDSTGPTLAILRALGKELRLKNVRPSAHKPFLRPRLARHEPPSLGVQPRPRTGAA